MTDVPDRSKRSPRSGFASFAETLVITLFITALLFTYVVRIFTVSGTSMESTLVPGDKVLVNLRDRAVAQGDVVIINALDSYTLAEDGSLEKGQGLGHCIIKRVIATGGQTVDIDFASGAVTVDGTKLREDYVKLGLTHVDGGAFTGQYPVTVPEGYLFVLGDHRSVSKDSRYSEIGFVPVESVVGTVVVRVFPLASFGKVS